MDTVNNSKPVLQILRLWIELQIISIQFIQSRNEHNIDIICPYAYELEHDISTTYCNICAYLSMTASLRTSWYDRSKIPKKSLHAPSETAADR